MFFIHDDYIDKPISYISKYNYCKSEYLLLTGGGPLL